jgi:hypothetical protein
MAEISKKNKWIIMFTILGIIQISLILFYTYFKINVKLFSQRSNILLKKTYVNNFVKLEKKIEEIEEIEEKVEEKIEEKIGEFYCGNKFYSIPIKSKLERILKKDGYPFNYTPIALNNEKWYIDKYGKHINENNKHFLTIIIPLSITTKERGGELRCVHAVTIISFFYYFLQNRKYEIMIVYQDERDKNEYNKGAMFNLGVKYSNNKSDYYALHDVDLIPESESNSYHYHELPILRSVIYCNYRLGYKNPTKQWKAYNHFAGGVMQLTKQKYYACGGYSNAFYGYGGEDDEFYKRLRVRFGGKAVKRPPDKFGKMFHLSHKSGVKRGWYGENVRYLKTFYNTRQLYDGIHSFSREPHIYQYEITKKKFPLYTILKVYLKFSKKDARYYQNKVRHKRRIKNTPLIPPKKEISPPSKHEKVLQNNKQDKIKTLLFIWMGSKKITPMVILHLQIALYLYKDAKIIFASNFYKLKHPRIENRHVLISDAIKYFNCESPMKNLMNDEKMKGTFYKNKSNKKTIADLIKLYLIVSLKKPVFYADIDMLLTKRLDLTNWITIRCSKHRYSQYKGKYYKYAHIGIMHIKSVVYKNLIKNNLCKYFVKGGNFFARIGPLMLTELLYDNIKNITTKPICDTEYGFDQYFWGYVDKEKVNKLVDSGKFFQYYFQHSDWRNLELDNWRKSKYKAVYQWFFSQKDFIAETINVELI